VSVASVNRRVRVIAAAALLLSAVSGACPAVEREGAFSSRDYAAVLKGYVDEEGMVDYGGLKEDRGRLDAFAGRMGRLGRGTYRGWTDREKIAFWINAYNALTLQVIIDHYPIKRGACWRG